MSKTDPIPAPIAAAAAAILSAFLLNAAAPAEHPDDSRWWPGFDAAGFDGAVNAIAFYGGELIAGGAFTQAGDTAASRIAAWNGQSWRPLGGGLDADVFALAEWNGGLIAGGCFSRAVDVVAPFVACWNGSSWSRVGYGPNGEVRALAVHNGHLIAAGRFNWAGGANARNIARWDGQSWYPLHAGLDGLDAEARALAVLDGVLYAGGRFDSAGDIVAKCIACWEGYAWRSGGFYPQLPTATIVHALAPHEGAMCAAAHTDYPDGGTYDRVLRWDGGSWRAVGAAAGHAAALASHAGQLIAAGSFTAIDGVEAARIARWDGSGWRALGSGLNDLALALCPQGDDLFVGGWFTTAGGAPSRRIARWREAPSAVQLAEFAAAWQAAQAVIRWRLGAGGEECAFHLWREDREGARALLTGAALAGQPAYEIVDPAPPAAGAAYWLQELAGDGCGAIWHGPALLAAATGRPQAAPRLISCRPNPANPRAALTYELPRPAWARLAVHDLRGRLVAVLAEGFHAAGGHAASWSGRDASGRPLPAGVYIARLDTEQGRAALRMILAR